MFGGGVSGNEVQEHMHAALVRLEEQLLRIFVRAVSGSDGIVVCHIVACVAERRSEAGVDPDRVAAQFTDIIQTGDDALQISDTVGVGVLKRLRIYFIKNCVIKPLCHMLFQPFFC